MRVLIVEDDLTTRQMLLMMLAPHGQCDVAQNGKQALDEFVGAREEGEPYDLICLDILMPELDGHEVLKQVRKIELDRGVGPGSGVKVIITTAVDERESKIEAFRSQCEAYLVKPISKEDLLSQIRSLGLLPAEG
jgi:two-component system chemotaxis response regulator CheY